MLEENFRRAMLIASGDLMVSWSARSAPCCSRAPRCCSLVPEIRRRREVLREE
jgi:hypothetical protein